MMKTKSNNISVKPVKKYSPPKYPDFAQSKLNPELLKKLPERWQSNKKILLGLSLLGAISLSSCDVVREFFEEKITYTQEEYESPAIRGLIAMPPIMSEQDALEIIWKEMSEHGIDLNYNEILNENESEREKIDLISESGNIGITYVNKSVYYNGNDYTSEKLTFSEEGKDNINVGIFEYTDEEKHGVLTEIIYTNEEEIKARVRDFIEWLQGQGII